MLFIAVKHAVATGYIPRKVTFSTSHLALARYCAEAARRNTRLCHELFESNQVSAFATLDYHYAFTAAIAAQLARLVPEISMPTDEEDVSFLSHYLLRCGEQGNESARDCAKMVRELGAVVSRLLADYDKRSDVFPRSTFKDTSRSVNQRSNDCLPGSSSPMAATDKPRDLLLNDFDPNMLPEGQSIAYQEILSWFQETPS